MARVVAIDYGTKRVGIAVTDPGQLIATPLDTVHAKDVLAFLLQYVQREPVERFVVGMPRHLDNTATDATPHVVGFVRQLRKQFPEIPVQEADERFTSRMAFQAMIDGGLGRKARRDKAMVDKLSATILLQSYLESRR